MSRGRKGHRCEYLRGLIAVRLSDRVKLKLLGIEKSLTNHRDTTKSIFSTLVLIIIVLPGG